jgi:hypothetical protein
VSATLDEKLFTAWACPVAHSLVITVAVMVPGGLDRAARDGDRPQDQETITAAA